MLILCKFYHNKHNTLDGATYDQHDCRRQTTWKKIICCTPANSSSLITSATNNNARVQMSTASWTCVQYVHHSPVRHPAGDASTGWYCNQWTSVTVRATPARSPDCFDESVKAWSAPSFAGKFLQKAARELQFFSTRNAFKTILSSRVILPIKMHKRGYYSTVLFFMKTGSYSQNITINANTNKY